MLEPGHKLGVESRHKRNFKHDPLSEESRDLAKLHGRGNTWHHNVCCAHCAPLGGPTCTQLCYAPEQAFPKCSGTM